jgi:hypothetical protein
MALIVGTAAATAVAFADAVGTAAATAVAFCDAVGTTAATAAATSEFCGPTPGVLDIDIKRSHFQKPEKLMSQMFHFHRQ